METNHCLATSDEDERLESSDFCFNEHGMDRICFAFTL